MITSAILIHSAPVVILVNFDSKHTFIVKMLVKKVGVSIEDLGSDLVVLTPVRAVFTTSVCVCVRGVVVAIQ